MEITLYISYLILDGSDNLFVGMAVSVILFFETVWSEKKRK